MASPLSPNGVSSPGGGYSGFEVDVLLKHISDVLLLTLGASQTDLESTGSLLSRARLAETTTRVTRYATESQTALYIQKDVSASDTLDGVENKPCMWSSLNDTRAS